MTSTNQIIYEEQLAELRARVREIRTAKKWLQDYRINATIGESKALSAFYVWLCKEETNTVAMGKRISESK